MSYQPIRAAILSFGMSGEVFHAPLLNALPEYELSVIVQRRSLSATNFYPRTKIVRDPEDVFMDKSIELVVVNTPNDTHLEYAKKAIRAGKHVVVEKPFTVSAKEADELIALAADVGVVLSVFQNRRWDSDFLTIQQVLRDGELGRIVEFEAHYDRFRNYIQPNTWKEQLSRGNGIVYNLGSHMLDQVVVLFGLPLYVDARIGIQRQGGKVDDFYDIRMEYSDHLVIVKSSYLVKEDLPRYIIHGVNGSFVKFGFDPQEQALKENISPLTPGWGEEAKETWGRLNVIKNGETVEKKIPSIKGDYLEYYRNVCGAIRNDTALAVKPEQARDIIRIIEACYESNSKRCAVKIQ